MRCNVARTAITSAAGLAALAVVGPAHGFALFDFPNPIDVEQGAVDRWLPDAGDAWSFSYTVQDDLLGGGDAVHAAVDNAFATWHAAHPRISYADAGYAPIENTFTNWLLGNFAYEGPGLVGGGEGVGANVDVMSRPAGWSTERVDGTVVAFDGDDVATAVPFVQNNVILSFDVYLAEDLPAGYYWSTSGSDDPFALDVETVVLHEIGHTLGLDHPDRAGATGGPDANSGANYEPYAGFAGAAKPGWAWTSDEVMHSRYTGVKRELTDDEFGGLAYLYGGLSADFNLDGAVGSGDLGSLAVGFGQPGTWADGDADGDGVVGPLDLNLLGIAWGSTLDGDVSNGPAALLGVPTTPAPEPSAGLIGAAVTAGLAGVRRRRR